MDTHQATASDGRPALGIFEACSSESTEAPQPTSTADAVARAEELAEEWAGDILDGARVPELHRYATRLAAELRLDIRSALSAADYFNDINLIPSLGREAVTETVFRAYQEVANGMPRELPQATSPTIDLLKFERPSIRFAPDKLIETADQAEAAMLADPNAEPVFAHGGAYATVRVGKPATAREASGGDGTAVIFHYDMPALRERLMASADFWIWKGKADERAKAPDDLTATVLSRRGGAAPALTGLLRTPTVTPSGRVIDQPGHDIETGLYADFRPGQFPALKSYLIKDACPNATATADEKARAMQRYQSEWERAQKDARVAYEWLRKEVFGEFDFRERIDESAAIAALVTGLVRPTCGPAPAFLMNSGAQSNGKTTLAESIGRVVEGCLPGLNGWAGDDQELEKTILAARMAGGSVLVFDNLPRGTVVRSDKLARLLTTDAIQGRILGKSRLARVSADVLVLMTGNNIGLEGDMATRVVEIYLDSPLERPDCRTFKRDIKEWVRANRGEVVEKGLTVAKTYLDAGAPNVGRGASRFGIWDITVRRAIVWAGGEDIGAKFDRAHEADPLLGQLRDVLQHWRPALGDAPLTAGEIIDRVNGDAFEPAQGESRSGSIAAFGSALRCLVEDRRNVRLDKRTLGMRLKQYVNRTLDGVRLTTRWDAHKKQNVWSIIEVTQGTP